MEIKQLLTRLLPLGNDWEISQIVLQEASNRIDISIIYTSDSYVFNEVRHKLYDELPEREWQHLSWFQYRCFIKSRTPRFVNKEGKAQAIPVPWADSRKGYTNLFAQNIIAMLQLVQVQSKVAIICSTSEYIVRSIMEDAVNKAIDTRGVVSNLEHISIDEKAFARGHEYASILIDAKEGKVLELTEGRKAENVKAMMFALTNEEVLPQVKMVNLDMWEAYMNSMKTIAPNAVQVHDKFHLIQKLSNAINATRKREVKTEPLLKKARFSVLKNAENRTIKQQEQFKAINEANLLTAQAWRVRENFKAIFEQSNELDIIEIYDKWVEDAIKTEIKPIIEVLKTFERHLDGIFNAIKLKTTSAQHERINGNIQSLIAKARGFINFDRFRINVMFYFSKMNFSH
jgi:transposase